MRALETLLLLIGSTFAFPSPAQVPLLSTSRFGASKESAQTNANAIFNAIHSSMRQWGSSLHHNGMSFFLASIPEGVMLYHGTHTPERVKGFEWLAFEIEHAENFAQSHRRPPGPPGRFPPGEDPNNPPGRPPPSPNEFHGGDNLRHDLGEEAEPNPGCFFPGAEDTNCGPPGGRPPPSAEQFYEDDNFLRGDQEEEPSPGYLHMYRTNRRIDRLLYIDGLSAGKTNLGTLDTQDILLLNFTGGSRGMFGEHERATKLCAWGKKYGIEGYIRTEAGIEIIWCDFEEGLDFVSHNQRPSTKDPANENGNGILEYYRAMSARYHGITASRVTIDYSSMISAFFYPLNLSNPDLRTSLPRLLSTSDTELATVKSDLEDVLSHKSASSVDWQGVVDMIVARYNTRLPYLATKATKYQFRADLNTLLNVFIDYNATSIDSAVNQCTKHYLRAASPSTSQDFLIFAALEEVSHRICEVLFGARELALVDETDSEEPPSDAVESLNELMEWLNWTDWKQCGPCAYDEVCVTAIWPFGTVEDHEHPSCQNSAQLSGRRDRGDDGYWRR